MRRLRKTRGFRVSNRASAWSCAFALLSVIVFGTCGFTIIEDDWSLWRSLFFTLITITTVGYGDENISAEGEVFAAFLLLAGIGTATYSLTSLVQIAVSYHADWKAKMQKEIERMQDHFLVCGFGRMGQTVCEELHAADVPLVVIDANRERFELAVEQGYHAVCGNSADEQTLQQAGIERAKGVVTVCSADAENMFITLTARDLNQDAFIAARASNQSSARRMKRAGATVVVSPYVTAGVNIAEAILRPKLAEFLQNSRRQGCEFEMTEFTVPAGSPVTSCQVKDVGMKYPSVVFVAMNRPGEPSFVRPGGDQVFEAGDLYTIAGHPADLENMLDEIAATSADAEEPIELAIS